MKLFSGYFTSLPVTMCENELGNEVECTNDVNVNYNFDVEQLSLCKLTQ